jgi:Ca-activated chloride channel homolog
MSFGSPQLLGLLAVLPVLMSVYVALARRQSKRRAELAAAGFSPNPAASRLVRRKHVPYVFFLLGLTLLVFSLARPRIPLTFTEREGVVVLAFDVSNSMRAVDLQPSRIEAAKVAARAFVQRQPKSIKIGVVAFSDGGIVTQQPTNDREVVTRAINRLSADGSTSLGGGIFASLNAIAGKPIAPDLKQLAEALAAPDGASNIDVGYFGSSAIVMLSDGEDQSDLNPVDMARLASAAGVKIYTVGVGSPDGTTVEIDGFSVATALNERALTEIATTTNGKYFLATTNTSLTQIYSSIDLKWKTRKEDAEITFLISAASAVLCCIGAGCSLRWFGKLV